MTGPVQICNRGLSMYLGKGRINDLSENSPAAVQCDLHYDDTLESLLQTHNWNFAKGRVALAELENDRPSEWSHKYARPSGALFVRWVNDPLVAQHMIERGEDPDAEREMVGQNIYSNVPAAHCEFTQKITDTTLFPPKFRDALSALIAASVAIPLTKDFRLAQNAQNQAVTRVDEAIARDMQEDKTRTHGVIPDYLKARGIS